MKLSSFCLVFLCLISVNLSGQVLRYSILKIATINNDEFRVPEFKETKGLATINFDSEEIIIKNDISKNSFEILSKDFYYLENGDRIDEFIAFDFSENKKCKVRMVTMANPPEKSTSDTQIYIINETFQIIFYVEFLET